MSLSVKVVVMRNSVLVKKSEVEKAVPQVVAVTMSVVSYLSQALVVPDMNCLKLVMLIQLTKLINIMELCCWCRSKWRQAWTTIHFMGVKGSCSGFE
jgi:hypothetical protein